MNADMIEPRILASVEIGSTSQQACSPEFSGPNFVGVKVNAPTKVRGEAGKPVNIPICGFYIVPIAYSWPLSGTLHVRISGEPPIESEGIGLGNPRNEAGRPNMLVPPGKSAMTVTTGGYFAIDLGRFIVLPDHPARVEFIIDFGHQRSAPSTFDWVPPPRSR